MSKKFDLLDFMTDKDTAETALFYYLLPENEKKGIRAIIVEQMPQLAKAWREVRI